MAREPLSIDTVVYCLLSAFLVASFLFCRKMIADKQHSFGTQPTDVSHSRPDLCSQYEPPPYAAPTTPPLTSMSYSDTVIQMESSPPPPYRPSNAEALSTQAIPLGASGASPAISPSATILNPTTTLPYPTPAGSIAPIPASAYPSMSVPPAYNPSS
ncbi:hypothetical protein BX616_006706 [Lobosporangium transversale]|uniref:Uncharacterized protein n=1 Tax=Lobosporangium transversale TaxID=64571 RepID=A0A1Y2H1E4_9FUNG|nr:hypothetical protein BCR41DRAFT_345187 [Lobosporangium transversale]KAF9915188.1 hypothetical protein BX616_006706 [Lobosporangium transversale]ORZ28370.1 hypothetical protein BCR41DRAFT_345187 [Lobosporangium transversale]|eukprot:XP_021886055.1 hypothetical protein BCR41DRAFT_345187 [Lobosporangium transversale]